MLLSVSPEPEAVLKSPPTEVVLVFSEPVSATSTAVRVFDPTGSQVSGISPKVEDSVLSAALPKLEETGSYTVAWKVVSDDGHVITGAFLFHLREATLKAPIEVSDTGVATLPRVLKVIGAIATWSGLIFALGMCAAAVKESLDRSRILAGLTAVAAGTAISFGAAAAAVGSGVGESLDVVLGTNSGKSSLAALILAVVLLIVSAVLLRGTAGNRKRSTRLTIQIGAGLVLVAAALEGHALALSPIGFSATLTLLHVVAAIVWISGLVWIERRTHVATPDDLADEVRRRSPWAMGVLVVLLASGVGLLLKRVPLGDLISSGYGLLGSLKLILLAMAVPLAWQNRSMFATNPTAPDSPEEAATAVEGATVTRFRASVRVEMVVLAAALIVGSVLAQVSPPGVASGSGGGSFSQKLPFGEGQVELTVDPGKRGMNEIHVTSLGTDGRLMAGIEDLELSMTLAEKDVGPLKPSMQVIVPGHSTTYARFPFAGDWKVVATAKIGKFTELSATFNVTIGN